MVLAFGLQPNSETSHLRNSKSNLFAGASAAFSRDRHKEVKVSTENIDKDKLDKTKKLPIINPLVRLPSWPSK